MQRIIEQTEDGSATLYVPELNEHYHSVKRRPHRVAAHLHRHGAEGLRRLLSAHPRSRLRHRPERPAHPAGGRTHRTACPLHRAWTEVEALHYSDDPRLRLLHEAPWEEEVCLTPTFRLLKLRRDLTSWQADDERPPLRCDVVYSHPKNNPPSGHPLSSATFTAASRPAAS